jgi:hypothetical protein
MIPACPPVLRSPRPQIVNRESEIFVAGLTALTWSQLFAVTPPRPVTADQDRVTGKK